MLINPTPAPRLLLTITVNQSLLLCIACFVRGLPPLLSLELSGITAFGAG